MGDKSRVTVSTNFSQLGRNSVRPYLVAALPLALLAAMAVGLWWINRELRRIDYFPDSKVLRAQLQKSVREAFERNQAEAGTVRDGKERQIALREAENFRDQRLANIDSFIGSIERPIATNQSYPEFLEFARLLEQHGLNRALDYLSSQASRVMELEKGSPVFGLLLEGVRLRREQGDRAEAERLSEKLLAAEPESSGALDEHFMTMMATGTRALRKGDLEKAREQFEKARASAERLLQISSEEEWEGYSRKAAREHLASVYNSLADVSLRANRLDAAREFSQRSVDAARRQGTSTDAERAAWVSACRFGAQRRELATVAQAAEALRNFEPKTPESLYNAACGYGLCAKLAAGWPGHGAFPPSPQEIDSKAVDPKREAKFIRTAMDLLEAAVKAGFKDVSWLEQDFDLDALHNLPQFKELVNRRH